MSSFLDLVRQYKSTRTEPLVIEENLTTGCEDNQSSDLHTDEVIHFQEPSIMDKSEIMDKSDPSPTPTQVEVELLAVSKGNGYIDISNQAGFPKLRDVIKSISKLKAVNNRVLRLSRELKKGRLPVKDAHLMFVMSLYGDKREKKWVGYPHSMTILSSILNKSFEGFGYGADAVHEVNTDLKPSIDNEVDSVITTSLNIESKGF